MWFKGIFAVLGTDAWLPVCLTVCLNKSLSISLNVTDSQPKTWTHHSISERSLLSFSSSILRAHGFSFDAFRFLRFRSLDRGSSFAWSSVRSSGHFPVSPQRYGSVFAWFPRIYLRRFVRTALWRGPDLVALACSDFRRLSLLRARIS